MSRSLHYGKWLLDHQDEKDSDEFKQIAEAYKLAREGEEKIRGSIRQLGQGLSLGFSEEIAGGVGATAEFLTTLVEKAEIDPSFFAEGGGFDQAIDAGATAYDAIVDRERAAMEVFEEENPMTSMGLQVAGGILTGGAGGSRALSATGLKSLPASTVGTRALQGAVAATPGGIIAGAGFEDPDTDLSFEESMTERAQGGALSGGLTAATGGALPVAGAGLAAGGKKAGEFIKGSAKFIDNQTRRFRGGSGRVAEDLKNAYADDAIDPAQALQMAEEIGGNLADVSGPNVRSLVQKGAAESGEAFQVAEQTIIERLKKQPQRLARIIKDAFGDDAGESVIKQETKIVDEMREIGGEAYDYALFDADFAPTEKLIDWTQNNPQIKQMISKAIKELKSDPDISAAGKEALDPKNPNMLVWHNVKRQLSLAEGRLMRSSDPNAADPSTMSRLRSQLTTELDNANPAYGEARQVWTDGNSQKDALNAGLSAFDSSRKKGVIGQDIIDQYNTLESEVERRLFRAGAGHSLINIIKNAPVDDDGFISKATLRHVLGGEDQASVLQGILPDEMFDELSKKIDIERIYNASRSQLGKISRAAEKEALERSSESTIEDVANTVVNAVFASKGSVVGANRVVREINNKLRQDPDASVETVARLMSDDMDAIRSTIKMISEATDGPMSRQLEKLAGIPDKDLVKAIRGRLKPIFDKLDEVYGAASSGQRSAAGLTAVATQLNE